MAIMYREPGQTLDIVLDCDATEANPTVWVFELMSPNQHARLNALIQARQNAYLETGGRPTDQAAAEKVKATEVAFLVQLCHGVRAFPSKGDLRREDRDEIARLVQYCIPVTTYDNLITKVMGGQGVPSELGKGSGSRSSSPE